jgi:valyl-tRNA synthetase
VPWTNAAISGFILDPDRKKMSKSKGNVVTPEACQGALGRRRALLGRSGRPGTDAAFDIGQMKVGRRLAIKILNASKFALGFGDSAGDLRAPRSPSRSTARCSPPGRRRRAGDGGFEAWDYTRSLELTESFFWSFCDDYLELVKDRAYGAHGEAAAASAGPPCGSRSTSLLRLFAPILPYVTEEVWSWWQERFDSSLRSPSWVDVLGRSTGA